MRSDIIILSILIALHHGLDLIYIDCTGDSERFVALLAALEKRVSDIFWQVDLLIVYLYSKKLLALAHLHVFIPARNFLPDFQNSGYH